MALQKFIFILSFLSLLGLVTIGPSYGQSSGFKKLLESDFKNEIVKSRNSDQKAEARTRLYFHLIEMGVKHASAHLEKGDMLWSDLTPIQRISWEDAYQGIASYWMGDLTQAEVNLRKSISSSLGNEEWLSLGFGYHQLANIFRDRGRFDSARINYSKAAEQYRKFTLSYFWLKLRTDRGLMFLRRSELGKAQVDIRNVFTLSQKFNDRELNAQAYWLLGEYHRNAMNFAEANQMLTRSFANTDSTGVAYWYSLQSKAELGLRTGTFESSMRDLQQLITNQNKFPNLYDRANLFLKTAEGYIDNGYYAAGVDYLNKCKAITSTSDYHNLSAQVDLNDAWMAYWLNNSALSLARLDASESSFLNSGDSLNFSNCLNVRGMNLVRMGQYDSALNIYNVGFKIREALGNVTLISASLFHLGELYNLTGDYDRALGFLWKGLKLDKALDDGYGVSMYAYQLAFASRKKGRSDSVKFYLNLSIATGVENKSFESLQKSYLLLSEIQEQAGNKQESLENLKRYIAVSDSISSRNSVQTFAAYQTMFDLEEQKRRVQMLKKDRMLLDAQTKNQQILVYVLCAGLLLSFGLWFFYYRFGKRMANLNVSLKDTAEEINQKNKELELALSKLSRAQDQLVKSEKMASVGVLASGIAHELNNPLNFIHGGLQQLEQQIGKPEKNPGDLATFVEIMKEGLTRATTILKGLGHYSRQSDKMDERCDIHKIIDNCLLILNNSLKYRIEVQKHFSTQEFILIGNEGRLHQALLNILSNAEQAIVGHGTISIKTMVSGPVKTIEISDSGYGISKENLSKLGSLFFTTKEPGKGTGFGLSISYKVIQEHGGTVEVESEVGVGTKFYLIFGGSN